MKKERKEIGLGFILLNEGQLPWLPKNPRQWTQTDIDRTAESIKRDTDFLEDRPLLVVALDKRDYIVFAGNLRYTGAVAAKLSKAPAVVYTPEGKEDEETIRRRALLDNGSFGSWDWDEVFSSPWGTMDLEALGIGKAFQDGNPFGEGENGGGGPGQPTETHEDDFNEEEDAIKVRCNPGDIWQLGEHRLMCGDSIDLEQVKKLTGGAKIDMVFTDPPYGYQYQSNFRKKTPKMEVIKNDDKILNVMPIITQLCEGWVFLCTTWKVIGDWLNQFCVNRELTNMIVWSKGGGGLGDLEHTFSTDYEIILVSNGGQSITGKRLGSVWEIMRDSVNNYKHPTQKPIQLPATAIENVSNPGDSVLDLFGGSGSTMMACEQLNRRCYMMEIDPHYCDVILARWEKLTGRKAEKVKQ